MKMSEHAAYGIHLSHKASKDKETSSVMHMHTMTCHHACCVVLLLMQT